MGRPALGINVLQQRGTYRSDRRRNNIKTNPCIPDCPRWLETKTKRMFTKIAKFLYDKKMISKVDGVALAMYCQALEDYSLASIELRKGNLTMMENGKTSVNPLVSIKQKAWEQLLRLSKEFGLTPASRAKFEMVAEDFVEKDREDFAG